MKFKELALISLVLVILSLAAVSASDLNQTTISHSSSDASLVVDSVTDASSDASLAVNIPVTDFNDHSTVKNSDSQDSSIVDNPDSKDSSISDASSTIDETIDNNPKDDGTIDNIPKDNSAIDNNPINNVPIDSDITDDDSINGDITPDDSIIRNMTNDSPVYNFDNSPITLSGDGSYFQNLQSVIDQLPAGSVLILSHDYSANCDFQIDINKDITIDGQGHTLNCNGLCRAFDSVAGNIILKNLKITNGYYNTWVSDDETNNGGAIWIGSKAKYTIENCTFSNCWADDMGGAIYNEGTNELTIIGCLFDGNTCDDVDGGAIYSVGAVYIDSSTFKNNHAYKSGGAVSVGTGSYRNALSHIINSVFDSNVAKNIAGGAIHSWTHLLIENCRFNSNQGSSDACGGAIYCSGNLIVESSNFTNNFADYSGGAIYCGGNTSINKCIFDSNKADGQIIHLCDGGAIHCVGDDLYVNNSTFKNNYDGDSAGAIYAYKNLYINWNQADDEDYNTFFISNTAHGDQGGAIYSFGSAWIKNTKFSSNNANNDGGAVAVRFNVNVIHSLFENNKCAGASSHCRGGAIYAGNDATVTDCLLQNNYAEDYGGAIFAEGTVNVFNSTFIKNSAENHGGAIYGKYVNVNQDQISPQSIFRCNNAVCDNGGAIYATVSVKVYNALFESNEALVDGGAIFSKGTVNVDHCTFDSNRAMEAKSTPCYGGAIRGETVSAYNSLFKDNYAENHGGAIFADYIGKLQNVSFIDNHARKDGGAIYINKACTIDISLCTFINNLANGDGGAIYLDSTDSKLGLSNNLFCYNEAKDGHAVYNKGSYGTIKNNWWGNKNPSTSNNVLVEWKLLSSNENHVDQSPLKLGLRLSSDNVIVGDIVRATLYFVKQDGSIFTENMPVDNIGFILPDGFENVSNNCTPYSAFIEFKPTKAGTFTIKSDLFWQYAESTLHVSEAALKNIESDISSLNIPNINYQIANPNLKSIDGDYGNKIMMASINGLNAEANKFSHSGNGLRPYNNELKLDDFTNNLNGNHFAHLNGSLFNCQFANGFNHLNIGSTKSINNLFDNDFGFDSVYSFILSLFGL